MHRYMYWNNESEPRNLHDFSQSTEADVSNWFLVSGKHGNQWLAAAACLAPEVLIMDQCVTWWWTPLISSDLPIHSWCWPLSHRLQYVDLLQTRYAVSLPDFPPNFRHPSSSLHPHHDDSQLPCKHHNSLKDIRPDHSLQTTLSGTDKTHGNESD